MRASLPSYAFFACSLAATAQAGQLVAVDSSRALYNIDAATGAKTAIGTVSANAGTTAGLARDSATGTIYLTSTSLDALFTLDLTTGTAVQIGTYPAGAIVMHGLEWDSSTGTLYGGSNGDLYTIDTTTGLATLVGVSGLVSFTNLGYNSATDTLYATNTTTPDSFYSVDRATGAMTFIGLLGASVSNPNGLAWDSDAGVMYLIDNSTDNLLTIDLATGVATVVGSTGVGNLLGLVYIPNALPPHVGFCFGDDSGTQCPCSTSAPTSGTVPPGLPGNGCPNSVNPNGANLAGTGSASISADSLSLNGTGMPNSSALYFQGLATIAAGTGQIFGDGLRCVGTGVLRLKTVTNFAGTSSYPELGDPSVSVRGQVLAPGSRYYQCWYRNAALFCVANSTFNLTNGLDVTWVP